MSSLKTLYQTPLTATRSGPLFNAHWYPTKISPEAIALMIACHTKPGDLIFDGFGGSCTTALATLLCSKPPESLAQAAKTRGLNPIWGPRKCVVYEITGLGSFIGQTIVARPNPEEFLAAANRVLKEAERQYGWLYKTVDEFGNPAAVRHFIWSDSILCSSCGESITFWDACVETNPARIKDVWKCSRCGHTTDVASARRMAEQALDPAINTRLTTRTRRLVRVDGMTGRRNWSRSPQRQDFELLERIQAEPLPQSVPVVRMMGKAETAWGDLWRAGYHEGITHVHHFYTRRNLIALGTLFNLVENEPASIRDALRFWISSYNSSHSSLMTRVVVKQNQPNLVLTSAQPGVLYISGLPVEKNVFHGLQRKVRTIQGAFSAVHQLKGEITVEHGSSLNTNLKDGSVDYVFTDPPFGGNIPYSEVNFISEAWLNRVTSTREEAVISSTQSKDIHAYESLLERAFSEIRRILKADGKATVVFHSTQSSVWRALTNAYTRAGFEIALSNILDKKQGSFKQVTTTNSAKGDPLLLLTPLRSNSTQLSCDPFRLIDTLLSEAYSSNDPEERAPHRIYARFVAYYLHKHSSPPFDAGEFYAKLALARSSV